MTWNFLIVCAAVQTDLVKRVMTDEQREQLVAWMAHKFELLCTGQVFSDLSKRPQGSGFNNADHLFYAPMAVAD